MDQLRDLSGLREGNGSKATADAVDKKFGRGEIRACLRIQEEEMLAGPRGPERLDYFKLIRIAFLTS